MTPSHDPPTAPDGTGPGDVRFVELAGDDARERLTPLADAWRVAGAAVELLRSRDRDDLWLLVVRGGGEAPAAVPADARTWRFEGAPR